MSTNADIVLIAGSPSHTSRSTAALEYVEFALRAEEQITHTLYARDLLAAALTTPAAAEHSAVQSAITAIQGARGVIVATPIYQAAYSGILKAFLDLLPQNSLVGKVVFPIATGGSPAHLLAIDYALKPVLSALGAREILQGVYLTDAQIARVSEGSTTYSKAFRIEESGERRLFEGSNTLLHTLYGPRRSVVTRVRASKDVALADH